MIFSYIDPGTGSMLISATIALFSVAFFMIKGVIYRKFNLSGEKGQVLDPNKHYGLVFYSEGKQYWNVFKPLLLECSRRGIQATFLTSDKNDPALTSELDGIEAIYIGSGREGYFSLNRLNADMVVMTTPGLDVLEIKRSNNVKHYVHLTHAPGCVAGYKSYALDYFDSVLIGGEGDIDVIRFYEELRNLPAKEIEVIGHTYVDVYREILKERNYDYSMFNDRRRTVLVSPTWSNHGLLTKYGKTLLQKLVDIDSYNVIIRPHPQSLLTEKDMIEDLQKLFPNSDHLIWDTEVENLRAMSHADIMISDYSGIIFDFFMLFNKPILTLRSHYEKRGRDVIDLPEDPWDIQTLDKIGATLTSSDIDNLTDIINETILLYGDNNSVEADTIANFNKYPNESGVRGVDFIEGKLKEIQQEAMVVLDNDQPSTRFSNSNNVFKAEISGDKKSLLSNLISSMFSPAFFYQATVASVLLTLYIYLGLRIFPIDGLNYQFFSRLLPYSVLVLGIFFVTTLILVIIIGKGNFSFSKEMERLSLKNILLIALPLTPILVYIVSNQDILSIQSSLYVFAYFAVISVFSIVLVPWLVSPLLDQNFSIAVGVGYLFTVFNMASFGRATSVKQITLILILLFLGVFFALFIRQKKTLMFVGIIFLTTTLTVSVFGQEKEIIQAEPNSNGYISAITQFTENKTAQKNPDVFILVYDSYSNQETMESYGFDNSEQIDFLLNERFTIYDGTYSVGASSLVSMGRMIGAESVEGGNQELRQVIAGDTPSFHTLRENGYFMQSVQTSDYMTKDHTPKHDFAFPDGRHSIGAHRIIIDAVIEGEFRFDAEFSDTTYDDFVNAKTTALSYNTQQPKYLYSHSDFPGHSQNSGVLRPDESERHFGGLDVANREMRQDIETIRSMNRDAIIIIAGDHGPYLTKNGIELEGEFDISEVDALDIQDRFGTFLAISWPENDIENNYDIKVIQDVIPAVIAYIFDDVSLYEPLRMDRQLVYTSVISGADVKDGIIIGGLDDGKPLFKVNGMRRR